VSAVLAGAPLFESTTKTAYVAARAVEYGATALFYGGLAFLSALWPDGAGTAAARRLLAVAWLTGTGATAAAIALEASWANGHSVWHLFQGRQLSSILGTDFGRQWAVMLLLWLLAVVLLAAAARRGAAAVRSLPWRVSAMAVGLATLRVFGLTGHPRETVHPLLAQLADVVHLAAMSLWFGGLMMLVAVLLPRRDVAALAHVVPRYSSVALLCVLAAIATGALLAWNVVGTVHGLLATTYGHVLLVKLAVLALVLAAAFGSKTWVEQRLDFAVLLRGESVTRIRLLRPLVLSVAAETGLLVVLLAVASVLVTSDPGR
jgi:copper transport protein